MPSSKKTKTEFGDFQTPLDLARRVCRFLNTRDLRPASIVEPTCGTGSFVRAAIESFPGARIAAFEIRPEYVAATRAMVAEAGLQEEVEVCEADFFTTDWVSASSKLGSPIVFLGNPPWVTNAGLGSLDSSNRPERTNSDRLSGIDAITGRSNFDVSEWILRRIVDVLAGRVGALAVLCKVSVARKVLAYAWARYQCVQAADIFRINSAEHFGVAVEACLLWVQTAPGANRTECRVFDSLDALTPVNTFGFREGKLVADIDLYERWRDLGANGLVGWRSGIKHDCSKVFELRKDDSGFLNGFDERVDVEPSVLYPLIKSSDVAAGREPRRWLLVTQRSMAESTNLLQKSAPKAWAYLSSHASVLDRRKSSIYKNKPPFSQFGVGPYSFAPWKVAISGLYKTLRFSTAGPAGDRPVVLDDTCYSFPCQSQDECRSLRCLLETEAATDFFSAFIFWDEKRPITARLLNSLDLGKLLRVTGENSEDLQRLVDRQAGAFAAQAHQPLLIR